MASYYDEIEIEDFEYDPEEETYYYPCPCGDRFQITKGELKAGEEVATCPSCSLIIKVIYDKEDFQEDSKAAFEEEEELVQNLKKVELGFTGGEALPAPVLQPPPTYPPLEHKAVPLKSGPETEYMVALKRDFVEFLHSKRQNSDSSSTIERFSDKYQLINTDLKDNWESQVTWEYLPTELNPKGRKVFKRNAGKERETINSKKPNIDITKKLDELAKLEDKEEEEEEEEDAKESGEKEDDDDNENKENPEEEDEDEEMDDGTDYVNNYFDNGESYFDDEDDNLDDGPVY